MRLVDLELKRIDERAKEEAGKQVTQRMVLMTRKQDRLLYVCLYLLLNLAEDVSIERKMKKRNIVSYLTKVGPSCGDLFDESRTGIRVGDELTRPSSVIVARTEGYIGWFDPRSRPILCHPWIRTQTNHFVSPPPSACLPPHRGAGEVAAGA
jgi:hypothetical protein